MTLLILLATLSAAPAAPPAPSVSLAGAWTLNKDLSDQPMDHAQNDRGDSGNRPRGGGFGGGGRRGGFGGGGRGGYGRGGGSMDPQEMARRREAMRQVMSAPDRLDITQTDAMIVITAPDGQTTRLSPDGKKVKDDNTKIERKTKWDGDKLVTEIAGVGRGKITESYAIDSEHHQLRRMLQMEGGRGGEPRTITYVYDRDADK